jgi:hypothetical protein
MDYQPIFRTPYNSGPYFSSASTSSSISSAVCFCGRRNFTVFLDHAILTPHYLSWRATDWLHPFLSSATVLCSRSCCCSLSSNPPSCFGSLDFGSRPSVLASGDAISISAAADFYHHRLFDRFPIAYADAFLRPNNDNHAEA